MGMLAGFDIGRTSAVCLLDEDTHDVVAAWDIEFAGGPDEQAWHINQVAWAAMRSIWALAYERGDEVLAARFEAEFTSRNPRVAPSLAYRRGILTSCLLRVHGPIATDAITAVEIRRQLGIPTKKDTAHAAIAARWPEVAHLTEHQMDAWAAARSLAATGLIVTEQEH